MEVWRFNLETSGCWLAHNDCLKCHGSTCNFEFGILSALGSCWEVRRQHCSGSFQDPEESWNSVPCTKSPSPVFCLPSSKYSPVCRGIHNPHAFGLWVCEPYLFKGRGLGCGAHPLPGVLVLKGPSVERGPAIIILTVHWSASQSRWYVWSSQILGHFRFWPLYSNSPSFVFCCCCSGK